MRFRWQERPQKKTHYDGKLTVVLGETLSMTMAAWKRRETQEGSKIQGWGGGPQCSGLPQHRGQSAEA